MKDRLRFAFSDGWPLVLAIFGAYGLGVQTAGRPWWVHALYLSAFLGSLAAGYYRARFGGNGQ